MNKPNLLHRSRMKFNSKFNMLFEDFMNSVGKTTLVEDIANPYFGKSVKVILEDINKPEYLVSASGKKILFETALKMNAKDLIAEGFDFGAVKALVNKVFKKIVNGIKAVLKKSMEAVMQFIEKIKNNNIVKKIISKYGLEEKAAAVKKGISIKKVGDTLKTVINRGKMKEAFNSQVSSIDASDADAKIVKESIDNLLLEDVIAEGFGDWIKKAKNGVSEFGKKVNNALTSDNLKRIGKSISDKAKGLKEKVAAEVKNTKWKRLVKICLAILAVGAVIGVVIAACSGSAAPEENAQAVSSNKPEEEEEEPAELLKHFVVSYDKNGDGEVTEDEHETFDSMEEYQAKVQELISDKKSFIGDAFEERLDENGNIVRNMSEDSGDFSKGKDFEGKEIFHSDSQHGGEKIEYADGTVMTNNMQTKNDYDIAENLAIRNLQDKNFREMSPEDKMKELEDVGFDHKEIAKFFKKHPDLIDKPGLNSVHVKVNEELSSEFKTKSKG